MQEVKITTGKGAAKREVSVDFDVPPDLAAAIDRWGEVPVYNCFVARLLVKVQDGIRNALLKADTYDAGTAQGLAQAEADTFLLDAPRATRRAVMPSVDVYLAYLKTKKDAGTLTSREAEILAIAS